MSNIILVAETGSDLTPELAEQYNIQMVPMHVAFDSTPIDDGSFHPNKIVAFYQETGKLPTTSGSTPEDFIKAFDEIHAKWPEAQILYAMRAPTVGQVKELYNRLEKIAKGAALMTETEVTIRQVAAYSNTIANDVINERFEAWLDHFLPLDYTEEELEYLRRFQAVLPESSKKATADKARQLFGNTPKAKEVAAMPIWNFHAKGLTGGKGSNDVGDVSWVCPTSIVRTACHAMGTPGHHWIQTAQGKSSVCHKGMLLAAAVMACTAIDFLTDPELVRKARENWLERLDGETYPNPLPADCKPEVW